MRQGIYPDILKIANVTLRFKSGDKDNISDYLPISVLPVFSKVLERIMHNTVYNHLDYECLLCEKQFGFKQITQLNMPYFSLHEMLEVLLKKRNIHSEIL